MLEWVGRLAYPAGVIEFVDDREEPLDPDAAAGRKAACGCATIASATSTGSTEFHRTVCEALAFLGHDEADAGQPRPLEYEIAAKGGVTAGAGARAGTSRRPLFGD